MIFNHEINIIIADDHELFRDGFKLMLSKQTNIKILAEAENGKELLDLVEKHQPQVVITDIKMPLMDGIEVAKKITEKYPTIGVIALSMFDEDDLIIDMLEAGAKGYLLKNADKEKILEAIRVVYEGNPYYCHTTSNKLTQMIAKSKHNPYKKRKPIEFSEKEIEIIQLICKSLTNKEIGEKLFMSTRTVEGYRLRIMEKMDVKNPVGLVLFALKTGLVKLEK